MRSGTRLRRLLRHPSIGHIRTTSSPIARYHSISIQRLPSESALIWSPSIHHLLSRCSTGMHKKSALFSRRIPCAHVHSLVYALRVLYIGPPAMALVIHLLPMTNPSEPDRERSPASTTDDLFHLQDCVTGTTFFQYPAIGATDRCPHQMYFPGRQRLSGRD